MLGRKGMPPYSDLKQEGHTYIAHLSIIALRKPDLEIITTSTVTKTHDDYKKTKTM